MKTLTEAVKACGGVWPDGPSADIWVIEGPAGVRVIQLYNSGPCYTRAQFESHADELSGKPGWGEAPEWAVALAQDESGDWIWYEQYPKDGDHDHEEWLPAGRSQKANDGSVLGDWRDTLERRPEGEADDVAFKPTWDGVGLPVRGVECECYTWDISGLEKHWVKCDVVGPYGDYVVCAPNGGGFYGFDADELRPLKSDRERWCELAGNIWNDEAQKAGDPFAAIYDALKSGDLSVPE